jgi:hypothetical protein
MLVSGVQPYAFRKYAIGGIYEFPFNGKQICSVCFIGLTRNQYFAVQGLYLGFGPKIP